MLHSIRLWLFITLAIRSGLLCSQAELGVVVGFSDPSFWRSRIEDGRGDVEASIQPTYSLGLTYAARIEPGDQVWMRGDVSYTAYRIHTVEYSYSLCCSSRDSSAIETRLMTLRMGPELHLGKRSRLYLPIDFAWALSATSSGVSTSFIPPDRSTNHYSGKRSDFGSFNVSVGAGLSYHLPLRTSYGLSIGPLASFGLFDQERSMTDLRMCSYGLTIVILRNMASAATFAD